MSETEAANILLGAAMAASYSADLVQRMDDGDWQAAAHIAIWKVDQLHRDLATARAKPVCKVRAAGLTDPPQDCDWPHCGCDPEAMRVLTALEEEGWTLEKPRRPE